MRAGSLVLLLLGTACQKGGSSGLAGDPHASPEAAARCQLAAFQQKNAETFLECIHPDLRAEFRKELDEVERKGPEFWIEGAAKMTKLATVKASDFSLTPVPEGKESYGDQVASYRFSEHGQIEIVRKDGKWYVVDPD